LATIVAYTEVKPRKKYWLIVRVPRLYSWT